MNNEHGYGYRGWNIEYGFTDDTMINPVWIISKGEREIWLYGSLPLRAVIRYIDQIEDLRV